MKIILKTLKHKISIIKGMFYSMIEFFFSGITPSSMGGQPTEIYYMTKDNVPIRKSYITLMLNTIYFKFILVLLGIIILIFHSKYIFSYETIYVFFFFVGLTFDTILIIICNLLVFKQKILKTFTKRVFKWLSNIKFFERKLSKINLDEFFDRYKNELVYIKGHKLVVFYTFIITFIQRILLFSIAYVIYRALGFNSLSYFDLLFIQVSVQLAIEFLPIPGGAGLSEGMLHNQFTYIFASQLADVGMLLTRTFSFYIPLLLSGFIIVLYNIINKIRNTIS